MFSIIRDIRKVYTMTRMSRILFPPWHFNEYLLYKETIFLVGADIWI